VALPEKLARLRIETLTHCLEVFAGNFSFEPKEFSAATVPLAFDGPILVVVVALLEVALCIALAARHGTNRQHNPTLALFEIRGQIQYDPLLPRSVSSSHSETNLFDGLHPLALCARHFWRVAS
jgi:hypothetical protein